MISLKTLAAAAALSVASVCATAQDLKFAHINSQEVVSSLPEFTQAQAQLQEEATKLEDQLKVMSADAQQKIQDYVASATLCPSSSAQPRRRRFRIFRSASRASRTSPSRASARRSSSSCHPSSRSTTRLLRR